MKQNILLIAFTLLSAILFSQAVPTALKNWETNAGIQAMFQKNITKVDASGNVYTAGATLNANGKYDIFLTKVSSGGTLLYSKQINGTSNDQDFALGLALNGTDVYMTGSITNGTVTPIPELFLVKYNSSGTQQFISYYSGGYGDVGKDLVVNATYSTCVVTGASYNNGFTSDMVVVGFDMYSGTQNWVNGYDHPYGSNDAGIKIATKSNNCIVTSAVTAGANQYKLVTTQYTLTTGSGSGTLTAGAVATSSVEIISDIFQDVSGNIYLCGATQQNVGQGYDMYIAKVTSSLTIAWEQTINGFSGSSLDDFAKGIQVDVSGNVYVTGVTTHSTQGKNISTIKLNSSGTVQWTKNINGSFNGNDGGSDLAIDASNNIYVTGYKTISSANSDFYNVKLDNATGNIIWENSEVSLLNDEGTNIILDNNDVIVAGSREKEGGTFEYMTYKYVQKDVITPTDFNGETPSINRLYYPNRGQLKNTGDTLVPQIKYYTNNSYPRLYFENTRQSYVFSHIDTIAATNDTVQRIDLKFTNGSEAAKIYPLDEQHQDYLNYFLAHTPSDGVTKVFGNQRLITPNLYTNIDLMCSSNDKGIKYYFIVKPGGDMREIKWEFSGATSYSLNGTSNFLSINSLIGSITFDKPIAYQLTSANATVAVTSFSPTWIADGASNKYKFNDGAYTSSLTLVIEVDQGNGTNSAAAINDLDWSTFYGSSGNNADNLNDISSDKRGNISICGLTTSNNFPLFGTNIQSASGGNEDAIVLRFNKNGVRQFATYYGGTGNEGAGSGVLDTLGNYYITGKTTALIPFPAVQPSGAFVDNTANGGGDLYIAKFDTAGKVRWATLYGGSSFDYPNKINMDGNGNLVVVGYHGNGTFPLFPKTGAYNSTKGPGFIIKFTSTLALDWVTKYGNRVTSPAWGAPYAIEFDDFNDIYIAGLASDSLRPKPLAGAYNDTTYNGPSDDYLTVFDANTDTIKWCTYIGGSGGESGDHMLRYANRNMYFTSITTSPDFRQKHGPHQYFDTIRGFSHFIMKFSTVTKKLLWSTGFKASIFDMTRDKQGNVIFYGMVNQSNDTLPVVQHTGSYWQPLKAGRHDLFISAFNQSDSLIYSTHVGGSEFEVSGGVTSFDDYLFITGYSNSGLSVTTPYPLANLGGTPAAWWQPDNYTGSNSTGVISRFNFSSTLYVGIEEFQKTNNNSALVNVYPNPSSEIVYLKFKTNINEKILVEVYDILGRNMYLKSFNNITENQVEQLDLSNYTNGMYLIKISSNKQQECIKIIKEH